MGKPQSWSAVLGFVWSIRDEILRYHYERHQVGDVILPLVVLRRLDLVLAPTKGRVLEKASGLSGNLDSHYDLLCHQSGHAFYNTSKFDFETLVTTDPEAVKDNFLDYLNAFSPNVRDIIAKFGFLPEVDHMDEVGILLRVLGKFTDPRIDLSPTHMSTMDMGYLYEELLRLSADLSNKEAGDHFTPREVIRLMTTLLVADTPDVHKAGRVFTVYDPTAGTGGMLTEAEHRLLELNPEAKVYLFGQEILKKSFAVCSSDMLIKGQEASNIAFGDTLAADGFPGRRFDYVIANPPYGADWAESMDAVKKEHARGFAGRFGAGLPTKDDGQLLFVQHMIAKTKAADEGGGRIAVVLNEGPLFAGDAGSGESNIRRWLFENDYVEAIIGLPDQLFYNTGISTYIWVLSTSKAPERQGQVQLIDARDLYGKMPRSLGYKRNELLPQHIQEIVSIHEAFIDTSKSRVLPCAYFGYTKVVVDRPLVAVFCLNDETREQIASLKALDKIPESSRQTLLGRVVDTADFTYADQDLAWSAVDEWLEGIPKAGKPLRRAIQGCLTVRNPSGTVVHDDAGLPTPDTSLRDSEYVPLGEDPDEFVAREVLPYASDAWAQRDLDRIGYEVPFGRIFYSPQPTRELSEVELEVRANADELIALLDGLGGATT